jgi:two-component system, sensor histidine kinase YesM
LLLLSFLGILAVWPILPVHGMIEKHGWRMRCGEVKHIKSKLLTVMIPMSIIPMLLVGMVSYLISTHALQEKIDTASMQTIKQASQNMDAKTDRITKYMDILFGSEDIQEILATVDFVHQAGDAFMAYYKLDPMVNSLFYKDQDVRCASLFSQKGGQYVYKGYLPNEKEIREKAWFKDIVANDGHITWLGLIDNPDLLNKDKQVFAVGRVVRDTTFNKHTNQLGVVILLLDKSFLSGIFSDEQTGQGNTVLVTDQTGRLMMGPPGETADNLKQYNFGATVLAGTQGSLREPVAGVDMLVTYTTSASLGWKVVRMIPYESFTREIRSIGWITFMIASACLATIWLLSFAIAGHISNPLKKLAVAMKRVGDKDFSVSVPVETHDEVGLICSGFNTMVLEIQELFTAVIEEEKEKRKINLRSLQYQINPHFLYNTLSSVRFLAISEKSDKVADMIMALSRLLRNTINKVGTLISVQEELDNLRDYISLQQIRYKNRLEVEIAAGQDVLQCSMPGMLLQPLVENAIEHGLAGALAHYNGECIIRISAAVQESELCFEVWDNGEGMSDKQIMDVFEGNPKEDDGVHIGLKNIHDRLRFQFGLDYGIQIESVQYEYACIRMKLPMGVGEGGHV